MSSEWLLAFVVSVIGPRYASEGAAFEGLTWEAATTTLCASFSL